jgi:hypothetical protein
MVREEFDSVGVLVSIFDSYREELVYYSRGDAPNPPVICWLGHGLGGKVGASQSPQRTENLNNFPESARIHQLSGISSPRVMACRSSVAGSIGRD